MFNLGKKYEIIYADPPWDWKTYSIKGAKKSPSSHYNLMTMEDIAKLPMGEIAADNCLMFLWATSPLLNKQIAILEGWGFAYKTMAFTWIKTNKNGSPFFGLGYYTRQNSEYVLLGRKGTPPRPAHRGISQVVLDIRREHSRKPDVVRDKIDLMYPTGNKLELFARTTPNNWDVWGNQTDKFP